MEKKVLERVLNLQKNMKEVEDALRNMKLRKADHVYKVAAAVFPESEFHYGEYTITVLMAIGNIIITKIGDKREYIRVSQSRKLEAIAAVPEKVWVALLKEILYCVTVK